MTAAPKTGASRALRLGLGIAVPIGTLLLCLAGCFAYLLFKRWKAGSESASGTKGTHTKPHEVINHMPLLWCLSSTRNVPKDRAVNGTSRCYWAGYNRVFTAKLAQPVMFTYFTQPADAYKV